MNDEKLGNDQQTREVADQETKTAEERVTLSKLELQKLIDSEITKAIKTRESNIEKKYKQMQSEIEAQRESEYRKDLDKTNQLLDEYKQRLSRYELNEQTKNGLAENNALDLLPIFDQDFSSSDGRVKIAKMIKEIINQGIQSGIKDKIQSPATPKTKPALEKSVKDMTPQEYIAYKNSKNLK
jgi:hypothetical protein